MQLGLLLKAVQRLTEPAHWESLEIAAKNVQSVIADLDYKEKVLVLGIVSSNLEEEKQNGIQQ